MTVKIVTDSSSDINPELAQQLGITVVPLYVRFGEEVYRDGVDMSADDFYYKLETGHVHPTTSAPAPGDFTQVYKKLTQETDEILSIHVSSKLSATYDAALRGKDALDETRCQIEVVDSQWVSMALELITRAAAKAAEAGESLNQVLNSVQQDILQTRLMGLLDTLKYLAKGGRIGKAASLLGTALNVKPLIFVKEGEAHPAGLARTRGKAIDRLSEFVKSSLNIQDLGIAHSTTADETKTLSERIGSFLPKIHPKIAKLGPVLGTHTGPGSLILALREGEARTTRDEIAEERKRRFSVPPLRLPGRYSSYHRFQVRELPHPLRLKLAKAS